MSSEKSPYLSKDTAEALLDKTPDQEGYSPEFDDPNTKQVQADEAEHESGFLIALDKILHSKIYKIICLLSVITQAICFGRALWSTAYIPCDTASKDCFSYGAKDINGNIMERVNGTMQDFQMDKETFDSFWPVKNQEFFRSSHQAAAYSLVLSITYLALFFHTLWLDITDLEESEEMNKVFAFTSVTLFILMLQQSWLSIFEINKYAEFLLRKMYHDSDQFTFLVHLDLFIVTLLISCLPIFTIRSESREEKNLQLLNNLSIDNHNLVFQHERNKDKKLSISLNDILTSKPPEKATIFTKENQVYFLTLILNIIGITFYIKAFERKVDRPEYLKLSQDDDLYQQSYESHLKICTCPRQVVSIITMYLVIWSQLVCYSFKNYHDKNLQITNFLFQDNVIGEDEQELEEASLDKSTQFPEDKKETLKFWKQLEAYRLDPTVPENMISWFILRTKILEVNDYEDEIQTALDMMSYAFLNVLFFIMYQAYCFIFVLKTKEFKATTFTILSICYSASFIIPTVKILFSAVEVHELVDQGLKQKLNLLDLNVKVLCKLDPQNEKLSEFQKEVVETIEKVNQYPIANYRFLWMIQITPQVRDNVTGFLASSLAVLVYNAIMG